MDDRDELSALRRMAELEAKAGGQPAAQAPPPPPQGSVQFPYTPSGEKPAPFLQNMFEAATSPQIAGGPMAAAGREGLSQIDKGIQKGAYEAGGVVTDMGARAGLPPEVSGGAGYLANVGAQAIPALLGGALGSASKPTQQSLARGLMKSAIKPSAANLEKGKVPAAVETMLKGGYSPTNSGVAAMRAKISGLSADVDKVIAPSKKAIDLARATQNVSGVADKARSATMGVRDADTALEVGKQLMSHPSVDPLGTMSVQAAQAMKQANYKSMGDAAYGMGLKPAAERDAIKAITAALKKNIESAEPAVAPINAEISDLLNAVKVSQRRALMEGNKDIVPLGASVATALSNPVAALGLYANSSAAVKAMLARMLYSGGGAGATAAGAAAGGIIGAESGRAP